MRQRSITGKFVSRKVFRHRVTLIDPSTGMEVATYSVEHGTLVKMTAEETAKVIKAENEILDRVHKVVVK